MQSTLPVSTNILFIADVHLGAFSDQQNRYIENDLIALVDYAERNNYKIALLGDIFDYWIEYPDFVPRLGAELLERLHLFNSQNGSALYITGNHDNWTLGHFTQLGFKVEPTCKLLHIHNQRILLLHGDATGPTLHEFNRPPLHRLIRNKHFLKLYRSIFPPRAGLKIMKLFSRTTRLLGGDEDDTNALNNWAKKMLNHSDIDYIICGHDHVPRLKHFKGGIFINTGSFYDKRTLAVYNKGTFRLVKWVNEDKQLISFYNQAV